MNVPYNKAPNNSHICVEWYEKFFSTRPQDCENINYEATARPFETDIYITSFGNSWFAGYQIKMLRKFFLSPHKIFIIDTNQNLNPEISAKLRETCASEGAVYLKAPDNHYQEAQHFDPTLKLGTVLSWLFHSVAKQRQPRNFGFLDHDCFLFRATTVAHLFPDDKTMYGTISCNGEDGWNLHVIANFYKMEMVSEIPLDFRASYSKKLDTGGSNWKFLYHDKNREDYRLSHIGVPYITTGEDISRAGGVQHHEIVDNRWIHSPALGEDQRVGDPGYEKKLMYIRGFLEGVLRASE